MWSILRSKQIEGFKFRRQEAIGPYIVDFVSFAKNLVIEIDGGQHGERKGQRQDKIRSAWLTQQGYEVMRFWNNDVLLNREAVAETIRAALGHGNSPSPQPSPIKGEGSLVRRRGSVACTKDDVADRLSAEKAGGARSPSPGRRESEGGGT